jgi:hypothetical protein
MKKVFKWGCMFFIVTFGISLALMLFNLPSEEEMAKIQVELELEKKEQLENFNKNKNKKWASSAVNVRSSAGVEEGVFTDNKSTVLSENQLVYTLNEITNGFEQIYDVDGKKLGWVSTNYLQDNKIVKEILSFKVVKKEKVGLKSQNRAIQKIIVQTKSLPNEDTLKNTATNIWKNNSNYDEFTVFVYLEDMDTNYNAYCIIEFSSTKMTDFMILESTLIDTKWE